MLFLFLFIVVIAGILLIPYLSSLKMVRVIKILSDEGRPKQFIKEFQPFIDKAPNKMIADVLSVNRTAGVFYMGFFQEAIDILKSIDPKNLPTKFYLLYYNDLLEFLLFSNELEEAKKLFENNKKIFIEYPKSGELNIAFKSTLANYEYVCGDLEKSKAMLESLQSKKLPKLYLGQINYFLGLIAIKKGEKEEAKTRLETAKPLVGETFLKDKINELLINLA